MKWKRQSTEVEGSKLIKVFMNPIMIEGFEADKDYLDGHYIRPH